MAKPRSSLRRNAEKITGEVIGYEHIRLSDGGPYRTFMHGSVTIPLHWHPELEIVFVLSGQVCFVVAGQECLMKAGDVMIINPNVVHNSAGWSDDAVVCGLHINADHYDRLGLSGFAAREHLCKSFLHGKHFKSISDPLRAVVSRLIIHQTGMAGESFLHRWLVDGLCYFIYQKVPWDRRKAELDARSNSGRERILHIMRRVRTEYSEDLSLQSLADEAGVSLSHLSRNFRAYVGLGFQDYIINLRLDRALNQVRTTDASISEIIGQSGFSNSTLFFSKFRDRFGCTPAEFRNGSGRNLGPHEPSAIDNEKTMALLLQHAGAMEAFGGVGAVDISAGQLKLSAPHGLLTHLNL